MNKFKILTHTLLLFTIWVLLYIFGRYNMFVNEQEQLFQWDLSYIRDVLAPSGGLAATISEFFIQFYHFPWLGTLFAALLIYGAFIMTYLVLSGIKKEGSDFALSALALLPVIPLMKSLVMNQGTLPLTAYLMVISAYYGIRCCRQERQWIISSVIVFPLFRMAGPAAILIPAFSLICADYSKRKEIILSSIPAVIFIVFGYLGIRMNIIGSLHALISPSYYVLPYRGGADSSILISWIASAVSILLVRIPLRISPRIMNLCTGALVVILTVTISLCSDGMKYRCFRKWSELHYLYVNGRYDDLLGLYKKNSPSTLVERNYINLSLLHTGRFLDDFFKYDPVGHLSLLTSWADIPFPNPFIWSEMTGMMGNIAKSQQSAFEGNMLSGPRGGAMYMKKLAESYIIRGQYKIAGRYIDQLGKSAFYRSWAKSERKFLNEKAVKADPYLMSKRKCLIPDKRTLANVNELEQMILVAKYNPAHRSSVEIAGMMTLAAGALPQFSSFLLNLYSTKALPSLPKAFQEGALMCFDNPNIIKGFGIPESRIKEYNQFKSTGGAAKNTVWHYISGMKRNLKKNGIPSVENHPVIEIPNN